MSDLRNSPSDGRPPQNVKPKLSSGRSSQGRQQREEKPKARKPRRSRSSDSERSRRPQRPPQGQKRQRGRSEEARRPERDTDKRNVPENDVDDTECAICFCSYDNVFKSPKLLSCGHTFCLECLARINVTSVELKSLTCPVCREVTLLPHGRDLPRLDTNQHILHQLPPPMRRLLSVRFKRSKGKLLLKSPPPRQQGALTGSNRPSSPSVKAPQGPAGGADLELGLEARTEVDVGRPPSRVRGRLRSLFRSNRCYYTAVGAVLGVTLVLMMAGVLFFVILPHTGTLRPIPGLHGNHTSGELSGEEP